MSETVTTAAGPVSAQDQLEKHGANLLKLLQLCVVLALLGVLGLGTWLYFHPSF